jgi:hypothetical protein
MDGYYTQRHKISIPRGSGLVPPRGPGVPASRRGAFTTNETAGKTARRKTMKKKPFLVLGSALLLAALFILGGCKNPDGGGDDRVSFRIKNSTLDKYAALIRSFSVTVTDKEGNNELDQLDMNVSIAPGETGGPYILNVPQADAPNLKFHLYISFGLYDFITGIYSFSPILELYNAGTDYYLRGLE